MQYTLTLPVIASARLYGDNWEVKYQSANEVTAGMYSGTKHTAFFRFGEFAIPSYATIISAQFKFRVTGVYKSTAFSFALTTVTDNGTLWTPTARNGAAAGSAAKSTISVGDAGKWYTANVLNIAKAWQSGAADPTRGIAMTAGGTNSWKRIAKETSSYVPVLTIVYEVPSSVPVLDRSTLKLGETVNTNIIVTEDGSSHVVDYAVNDQVIATHDIGLATSDSFEVSETLGEMFPTALTAILSVTVTTTVNGEERGSVSAQATITLPSDSAPIATLHSAQKLWISSVDAAGKIAAFVQTNGGAKLFASGTPKYGASISGCTFIVENANYEGTETEILIADSSGTTIDAWTASHLPFKGSGVITYTATIRDSRGQTASISAGLTVLPWNVPQIKAFSVDRVDANGNAAIDGAYVKATIAASASSLVVSSEQKNSLWWRVGYRAIVDEAATVPAWTYCDTIAVGDISTNITAVLTSGGTKAEFDDMTGYDFVLIAEDIYANSTAYSQLPTKETFMDVDTASGKIGFGGAAPSEDDPGFFAFHGVADFLQGTRGTQIYSTDEVDTGNVWIDGKPIYRIVKTFTVSSTNTALTAANVDNFGTLISLSGYAHRVASAKYMPVNFFYSTTNYHSTHIADNGDVIVNVSHACEYALIVEYTK